MMPRLRAGPEPHSARWGTLRPEPHGAWAAVVPPLDLRVAPLRARQAVQVVSTSSALKGLQAALDPGRGHGAPGWVCGEEARE